MSALAAIPTAGTRPRHQRRSLKPTCAVCAAQMVAAEASVLGDDNVVSYLWSCDICGYGFVTDTAMGQPKKADA